METKQIINFFLICCSVLSAGISLSLLSPFYPKEALSKGVSVTESGFVIGSVFISSIVFTPIFGKYMQVYGARKTLLFGFVVIAIGNISFGFLEEVKNKTAFFVLSILVRIFTAIGESALAPSSFPLAEKQVSKESSGIAISVVEACWGVGNVFGPSLGGALYDHGGFAIPFWVLGGVMLFIAGASICFLKDDISPEEGRTDSIKVTWQEILSAPGVLISTFALSFAGIGWTWHAASLEQFLWSSYAMTSAHTGLVFMLFGLCYTIFTPVFGFLTVKGLDGFSAMATGNFAIFLAYIFIVYLFVCVTLKCHTRDMHLYLGVGLRN